MARSDVQLMLDVKAGDTASFDVLLQKYRTPLVNFLYRMHRDTATAEDLAQEVFLRIYRARKDYLAGAKFTTWLFRIGTNLALNSAATMSAADREKALDDPKFMQGLNPDEQSMVRNLSRLRSSPPVQ